MACELNRTPVHAVVDTGAEMTVVTRALTERVGLAHLVDLRFAGVAAGLGSVRILGRIHIVPMKVRLALADAGRGAKSLRGGDRLAWRGDGPSRCTLYRVGRAVGGRVGGGGWHFLPSASLSWSMRRWICYWGSIICDDIAAVST